MLSDPQWRSVTESVNPQQAPRSDLCVDLHDLLRRGDQREAQRQHFVP